MQEKSLIVGMLTLLPSQSPEVCVRGIGGGEFDIIEEKVLVKRRMKMSQEE